MASSERRAYGSGSIYYVKRTDRWVYNRSITTKTGRRRQTVQRKTYDELIAWLRELDRRDSVRMIDHRDDKAKRAQRKAIAADWIERIMAVGNDGELWEPAYMARVIVAALSARRIRLNVFGPCAYCGDWLADTVDHVIPKARGGTDDPSNLVSACHRCNTEKNARLDYVARSA